MASLRNYKPLKMTAETAEDLKVFSASFQDAVMKVGDFAYLKQARRFAFVANRFVWECATARGHGPFARVRAGAHFDDVMAVRERNLRLEARDAVVELLAIRFEEGEDGGGLIRLDLAGGGAIELTVESLNAAMRDMSEPWRTRSRPDHEA
ncbi:MAG: DUF2948 family protein [Pseudomonadota bacterium]